MKTRKTITITLEEHDDFSIRLGTVKYRLEKVKATTASARYCWVWYRGPDGTELQEVLISALPLTLMTRVKAQVAW